MFRAYSRKLDYRVFSGIDRWLAGRGYKTDARALDSFINLSRMQTASTFFYTGISNKVSIDKINHYPSNYSFSFPSPAPSGKKENDTVFGDFFPRFSLKAPSVVIFSGWLETETDYSRLAHKMGLAGRNFWAMDLPYHARRTPQGTKSGELSITGDIVRTLNMIRQAVIDARVLVKTIKELGSDDIAVIGFSLGAWVGSLLALCEPSIARLILATPIVRPDRLLVSSPLFNSLRNGVAEEQSLSLFEDLGHLFIPYKSQPVIDRKKVHLLGSIDDPLAPPGDVDELASSWECEKRILPGGHITFYITPRFWKSIFQTLSPNHS
ncbi:hypothetical protein GX441_12325 [bacterium]|nr:hypothetical protein [bacterium]